MIAMLIVASAFVLLPVTVFAQAANLVWDKNTETDMKDYGVYMCSTPGCVVTKTPTMLQAYVVHPSTTFPIPSTKEGAFAVTARDLSLNESGLSVSIPFDAKSPLAPTGIVIK